MNKDVIYIDTEDDITAIIGKVKHAGAKIVALVPPKRAGVLQSAVNLRLLQKAASGIDKRVVLITNDHSLTALAAGVKMPIAKNLQSRPEVPAIQAPEASDEEVINGAELPVGEFANSMGVGTPSPKDSLADEVSRHVDFTDAARPASPATLPAKARQKPQPAKKGSLGFFKKGGAPLSIPNFKSFRKKVFLFGGIGVALILFLIWALVFAPHASITIGAQTTALNVDRTLTLDPKAASSTPTTFVLKPNVQQLKKSVAAQFAATGTKDIGNKATGTIQVSNCDSSSSFQLSAGTVFTSGNGKKFTSNDTVTVPGLTGSASACRNNGTGAGKVDVAVTAAELGDEYNIPAGQFSISGISGDIYARSSQPMSGGSHQIAQVVTQEDVDKAKQQLAQPNVTEAKNELKKQFQGDFIVIEESFAADQGQPMVEPAVGQVAQQAKITAETTYTLVAIARDDAKAVLRLGVDEALKDKNDLQMYSLGDNSITFQVFQRLQNGTFTARMVTTSYIGPKIDTNELAKQVSGKRYGEIDALVNQIPGVNKVDIKLSPFWVTTAPSPDRIDISFSVAHGR